MSTPQQYTSTSVRTTHTRSAEGRRRRNKKYKEKVKLKKRNAYLETLEEDLKKDLEIRTLQSKNALLSRTLKAATRKLPIPVTPRYCLPKSMLDRSRSKASTINQTLRVSVTEFNSKELEIVPGIIGEGAYGSLKVGKLPNFKQHVAVKEIIGTNTRLETFVEAKILTLLNGHKNLPLFFGWVKPNFILMEFIGLKTTPSPTLHVLLSEAKVLNWIDLVLDFCMVLQYIHDKGVLHNDLHPRNILIRDQKFLKIIDFGKACLVDDPVMYDIKPGSEKQILYNERHIHLAHELRNVPNSFQSIQSDIYSMGYNIGLISDTTKNEKLSYIAHDLQNVIPEKRPSIPVTIKRIYLLKHKIDDNK